MKLYTGKYENNENIGITNIKSNHPVFFMIDLALMKLFTNNMPINEGLKVNYTEERL